MELTNTIIWKQVAFEIFVFCSCMLMGRISFLIAKLAFRNNSIKNHKILIIGYNKISRKLARYLEEEGMEAELVGFVDDTKNVRELSNYPILAPLSETIPTATALNVQEIYSTISPEQNMEIYSMIKQAENKCMRFKIIPNMSQFIQRPIITSYIRDLPVISLRNDPLENPLNRIKKRLLDITVSSFAIVFVLSWLYPILGILIKLDSHGPIIFYQLRNGLNDRKFNCLKFRSMRNTGFDESKQATKHDNRITKIGKILRKSSLDEFPQFINVLIGDMSIVGPRPHLIKHNEEFSNIVDHYMIRQLLKPGITGWAQVNGYRGEIVEQEQLRLRIASDIWYLENWNIWLDIKIILKTVLKLFTCDKNAY